MVCLNRPYQFKVFKACPPQILLGSFLNNFLSHIAIEYNIFERQIRMIIGLRFVSA